MSQASAIPWSLSQSATSSSRSDASIGDRSGPARELASARAARSATASSLSPGSWLRTSRPSFSRISASISRSRALARSTAATGLFSSWVSPAVTEPRATSRSWRSIVSRLSMPWVETPSSRCAAIGYHSLNARPSSAAGSSNSRQSVTARAVAGYTCGHVLLGQVEVEGAGVGAAVVAAHQLELAALHPPRHRQHPRQQHEEARRRRALGVDGGAGRVLDDPTVAGQPGELVVVELLEEEQRAQLVGGQPLGLAH